jgi:hypothetical protein
LKALYFGGYFEEGNDMFILNVVLAPDYTAVQFSEEINLIQLQN